ncbi:SDR family oxidoreductase [Salinicola sp. MIT1003]|uniref:SDR family NAD(P)-dependent oxidoreductase n=1 Tax=Salinicola sp. MIT1003 TaxID=1882734 RepID=UPI0008DE481C|nr:SDR family oxidoreductase [Salinicola sp. MIT1003]OHZ01614.1 short-chain dehydrogenase [Salinicola sp. MIT1003]
MTSQPSTAVRGARLQGRVALVTGGASGVGQAVAELLIEYGCHVASLDLTRDGVPAGAEALIADLRDQSAVSDTVDAFAASHGRLDVLVNNAGVSFVGGVEEGSEADWLRVLDINVLGQMRALRAALPWLRRSTAASVVTMSSCTAVNGIPQRALYSASKGAVQSMSLSIAADLIAEGIRCNCVSPATVDTPFMTELANRTTDPAAKRREFEARQPTGHMVSAREVAEAVAWLADPEARSTTGATFVLDGGMGTLRLASRLD